MEQKIVESTIIDNRVKVYLIGSMEAPATNDGGKGWRERLTPPLKSRGIHIFDPTREEMDKVGMPCEELMDKLTGWQLSGNWAHFLKYMKMIWRGVAKVSINTETEEQKLIHIMGDVDFVERSTFLIWHHEGPSAKLLEGVNLEEVRKQIENILKDTDRKLSYALKSSDMPLMVSRLQKIQQALEEAISLLLYKSEGDKPGGTIAELVIAWYRGIPVYLVTDTPKSKFNKSLLYFLLDSGHGRGKIFPNDNQLLEFLDKEYDLKVEETNNEKSN